MPYYTDYQDSMLSTNSYQSRPPPRYVPHATPPPQQPPPVVMPPLVMVFRGKYQPNSMALRSVTKDDIRDEMRRANQLTLKDLEVVIWESENKFSLFTTREFERARPKPRHGIPEALKSCADYVSLYEEEKYVDRRRIEEQQKRAWEKYSHDRRGHKQ